jgi:hypothetical protein
VKRGDVEVEIKGSGDLDHAIAALEELDKPKPASKGNAQLRLGSTTRKHQKKRQST